MNLMPVLVMLLQPPTSVSRADQSPRVIILGHGDPLATACARDLMRPQFVQHCGEECAQESLERSVGAELAVGVEDASLVGVSVYRVINYRVDPPEGTLLAIGPGGECVLLNNWQLLFGGHRDGDAAGDSVAAWSRLRPRASRPLHDDEFVPYSRTVLGLLALPQGFRWLDSIDDIPDGSRHRRHQGLSTRESRRAIEAAVMDVGYTVDASGARYVEVAWTPRGDVMSLRGRIWRDGAMSLTATLVSDVRGADVPPER